MAKFGKNLIVSEKSYLGTGIPSKMSFSGKLYLALFLLVTGLFIQCLLVVSYYYEYRNDLTNIALSRRTNDDAIKVLRNLSQDLLDKINVSSSSRNFVDVSGDLTQMGQAFNSLKNNLNGNVFSKPISNIDENISQFGQIEPLVTPEKYRAVGKLYAKHIEAVNDLENVLAKYYQDTYREILIILIIKFAIICLLLLLAILGCKWLAKCALRSIDEPAERMIRILQGANGDLNVKLPILASEGLGTTGLLLNEGISKWHALALEFKNASNKFNYLVDELASGFNQVFLLEIQLQEVYREIEASLDGQKQMGKKVNEKIEAIITELTGLQYLPGKVSKISEELNSLLTVNKEHLGGVLNKQVEVNNESHDIKSFLRDLASTSKRVDRIMKELGEIEEESEMLAFNSAISAARAGEEGQGFSVVAKEIAKLVERSKKASNNLSELIGQIQSKTEQIVGSTPENYFTEPSKLTLDQIVNSSCSNLNETAAKCLTEINMMRQVVETIFSKSNETFAEIKSVSDLPQEETGELNAINNIIVRYLESIRHTEEVTTKIYDTINSLQSATNLLINRN